MSQDESLNEAGTESIAYIEALYADFLKDPNSVSAEWRDHFTGEAREAGVPSNIGIGPAFQPSSIYNPPNATCKGGACAVWQISALQERVGRLVHAYRVRGHWAAQMSTPSRRFWSPVSSQSLPIACVPPTAAISVLSGQMVSLLNV